MTQTHNNYSPGTVFPVPLDNGQFCLGVVVLSANRGNIAVCRFFNHVISDLSRIEEIYYPSPLHEETVFRVGDIYILSGRWPIVDRLQNLDQSAWAPTTFYEGPNAVGLYTLVTYGKNPAKVQSIDRSKVKPKSMPPNTLYGSRFAEVELTRKLCGEHCVNYDRPM